MTRQCGGCTLCCTLLPVRELQKKANTKCRHQSFAKGCGVYDTAKMPLSCKLWNCRWLVNDDTADLSRPDRSHLVVDIFPDFVTCESGIGPVRVPVIQVWVDPKHPDAWRTDEFRRYMLRQGAHDMGFLIRNGSHSAIAVFPPTLTGRDEWMERPSELMTIEETHSYAEIVKTLEQLKAET